MVHSDTTESPTTQADPYAEHGRLMKLATTASISMASVLLAAKFYTWWLTDSLSMLSSSIDSLFDVLMSAVNVFAVRYAMKPADDDHRFGHGSIEDIAGLAQCAFIFAAMAMILLQSIERVVNADSTLPHPVLGIGVSVLAMVLTSVLVAFQTYVMHHTKSLVVAADRLHYAGDILFNLGVLVAFALSSYLGWAKADAAVAIIIAVIVLWSNRVIGIRAFNNLMDREMPDEEKALILSIVEKQKGIRSYHKFKTRYSGIKPFIQLHVEINANLHFREAHEITDQLEKALLLAFPGAEVIIHPDPVE
jgi:ferrous-iron efflux pump FieF